MLDGINRRLRARTHQIENLSKLSYCLHHVIHVKIYQGKNPQVKIHTVLRDFVFCVLIGCCLVVSTSAIDCLEKLAPKMTYYVGLPWWLCGLIRSPVHAVHDYRNGWGSTPSHAGKIVSCCLACML